MAFTRQVGRAPLPNRLFLFGFYAFCVVKLFRLGLNVSSRANVSSEWRLDKSAIFGGLTFAITAAMGSFFEPVARLV
jgi:hypothetical protein